MARLIFGCFIIVVILYQLQGVVTFSWENKEYQYLHPGQQQQASDHGRSQLPNKWPKGEQKQQPPPSGTSGSSYPDGGSQIWDYAKEHEEEAKPPSTLVDQYNGSEDENETRLLDSHSDSQEEEQQQQQHQNHILRSSRQNLPRLYDVILFNDEYDVLEIRLNELDPIVDVFVILEAQETFQKRPKPLYFRLEERSPRFHRFKDRILHIVVPPMSASEADRAQQVGGRGWGAETYLRNKGLLMALDIFRPNVGDWIMHSDVDEVPRARVLEQLKMNPRSLTKGSSGNNNNNTIPFLRLGCSLYYYSYEYKHPQPWTGPTLAQFEEASSETVDVFADDEDKLDGNGRLVVQKPFWDDWSNAGYRLRALVRHNDDVPYVEDACWHCSWCFATTDQFKNKASSYSHSEHNQPDFRNEKWIVQHVREGKDLFDRPGQTYEYIANNDDLPKYIDINRDRFAYMLDRKGKSNAGFTNIDKNAIDY
ncbi:hypothetical protein BGW41_004656 [Actinomortierella wolfii]|nr:hypothetical protein BGW41_004656 [Actinomortierella wolfii]